MNTQNLIEVNTKKEYSYFRTLFIVKQENATHYAIDNGSIVYLSVKRENDATCLALPANGNLLFWMESGKKLAIA